MVVRLSVMMLVVWTAMCVSLGWFFGIPGFSGGVMSASMVLKAVGVVLICVGIHFGLSGLLPLIVFGAGLAMVVLS